MSINEKIFAFDVGKASLGICAREGSQILDLRSLLIPAEFAATADFRNRRRAFRTRQAHKKREEWFCKVWQEAGLNCLSPDDERLQREFPQKNDETIYNSALLRIALIQQKPLEEWQIFKALWAAIQLRGYETVAWAGNAKKSTNSQNADPLETGVLNNAEIQQVKEEKENLENAEKYLTRLRYEISPHFHYEYPCFLEASRMGLWSSDAPEILKLRIDHTAQKIRRKGGYDSNDDPGNTAPRFLVEKEIRQLLENAKKQLPVLQNIDPNEFLYGPGKKAYASYEDKDYFKYRGTEWDAQGVLSQKIPRFDNRILNKCRMLSKRNVCKASEPLNLQFNLLMKLKNIRFTDENGEVGRFFIL